MVVITGSATGIGAATALRFAAEGAAVACLDINEADNSATADAARSEGVEALALACDVRSRDDQEARVRSGDIGLGRIDVLVACAGIYVGGPLAEIPLERWEDIVAVNLTGVPRLQQPGRAGHDRPGAGLDHQHRPPWRPRRAGPTRRSTRAPSAAWWASPARPPWNLGPHGVTVNAVCAGNTLTDMVRKVAVEVGATVGDDSRGVAGHAGRRHRPQAAGRPEEIAGVVAFLASDDARYLTGQAIEVDGGLVLS